MGARYVCYHQRNQNILWGLVTKCIFEGERKVGLTFKILVKRVLEESLFDLLEVELKGNLLILKLKPWRNGATTVPQIRKFGQLPGSVDGVHKSLTLLNSN